MYLYENTTFRRQRYHADMQMHIIVSPTEQQSVTFLLVAGLLDSAMIYFVPLAKS